MPIYEYRCQKCGKKSTVMILNTAERKDGPPACEHCGSAELHRVMSSFGVAHTVKDIHERYSTAGQPGYYSDPRNIGRNVEESFAKAGMDVPGEVRQAIDSARSGEVPKEVQL